MKGTTHFFLSTCLGRKQSVSPSASLSTSEMHGYSRKQSQHVLVTAIPQLKTFSTKKGNWGERRKVEKVEKFGVGIVVENVRQALLSLANSVLGKVTVNQRQRNGRKHTHSNKCSSPNPKRSSPDPTVEPRACGGFHN